jgi:hypothetical protein
MTTYDDETVAQEQRLADELRRIIARLVLVRPSAQELGEAADRAAAFADRLDALRPRDGDGEISEAGLQPFDHVRHSPLSGSGNPIAPPVMLWTDGVDDAGEPLTAGRVTFGPAYEGPPAHVHGGQLAAMFDELLGLAQGQAGFTATLTITYRRPSPLGEELTLRGWVDRVEGRKRWVKGTCSLGETLLCEAEGLFIAPHEGATLDALRAAVEHGRAQP